MRKFKEILENWKLRWRERKRANLEQELDLINSEILQESRSELPRVLFLRRLQATRGMIEKELGTTARTA